MKKIISFSLFTLLTVLAVCSLTACGGSDDDETSDVPSTLTMEQARAILTSKKNWTVTKEKGHEIVFVFSEEGLMVTEQTNAMTMNAYPKWDLLNVTDNNFVKGKILYNGAYVLCDYQKLSKNGFQVSYDQGVTWLQAVPGEPVEPQGGGEEEKEPEEEEEQEDPNALRIRGQFYKTEPFNERYALTNFNSASIEYHWDSKAEDSYITSINGFKRQKDGTFRKESQVVTLKMNSNGTLASATNVSEISKTQNQTRTWHYKYDSKGRLTTVNFTDILTNGSSKEVVLDETYQFTWNNKDLITRYDYTDNKDAEHSILHNYMYPESDSDGADRDFKYSAMPHDGYDRCLVKNKFQQFPSEISSLFRDPFKSGLLAALGLLGPGPAKYPYNGAFSPSLPENRIAYNSENYTTTTYFVTPYRVKQTSGVTEITKMLGKEVTEVTQYIVNWELIPGTAQYRLASWNFASKYCDYTEVVWEYTKVGQ